MVETSLLDANAGGPLEHRKDGGSAATDQSNRLITDPQTTRAPRASGAFRPGRLLTQPASVTKVHNQPAVPLNMTRPDRSPIGGTGEKRTGGDCDAVLER